MKSIAALLPLSTKSRGGPFALKTPSDEGQWFYRSFNMLSPDGRVVGEMICCSPAKLGSEMAKALVTYVVCASNVHYELMNVCNSAESDIELTGHVSAETIAMLRKALVRVRAAY